MSSSPSSEQKSFFGFRSPRSCDISTPFPPTECTKWVCVSPRIKRGKIRRLNGLSIYFSNLNVRECAVYLFWGAFESFSQSHSARTSEIHHQLRTTLLMAARNESATLAPFQMEGKAGWASLLFKVNECNNLAGERGGEDEKGTAIHGCGIHHVLAH